MFPQLYGYPADYLVWWLGFISILVHTWCFFRFFPRERYRRGGLVVGNGLVFACLLGSAALVGETSFRFLAVGTDPFGVTLPAQRWFALHVNLNSVGCRDEEWSVEKPAGVYRIAFVGDSFTYGWGIEREGDRFTDLVEGALNGRRATERRSDEGKEGGEEGAEDRTHGGTEARRDEGAEGPGEVMAAGRVAVMNVAKPGWGSGDQIQPVKDMVDVYGVDEVVLCYVPNDIEKLLPRSGAFDPTRPPEPKWVNPARSALVEFLYYRVWVPRAATVRNYHDWLAAGFADEAIWREHQRQLYEMIRYCRERGVAFRVALLPFMGTGGEAYEPARVHGTLRSFFEANGVPVVDLRPVISDRDPASLVVSGYDAHPNETAHRLFAQGIVEKLYGVR